MGNALKKETDHDAIQLDVRDVLSAAFQRAEEVPSSVSILDMISSNDWKNMDEEESNILVFDPE